MKKTPVAIVVALLLASLAAPPLGIRAQARRGSGRGETNKPKAAQSIPAPAEVALLTQPEGNVQLTRGRLTQTIRDDMLLNAGDSVSVNGNGTAVVYQAYLPVKRLVTNERFKVELHSPPPPPPARALSPEEFASFKAHYLTAKQNRKNQSPTTQGGADDGLTLIEPRNSVALSGRPTFFWSRIADATKYVVNVYNKDESVLCTESTTETRLALPERCQPLAAGDYKWDVTAQIGEQVSDNSALYDATSFTVVTDDRAAEISAAVKHARVVAADGGADAQSVYVSTLMENKLYPLAEVESLRVLVQRPNDQALWALLIENYAQMKRWRSREAARTVSVGRPASEVIQVLNRAAGFINFSLSPTLTPTP